MADRRVREEFGKSGSKRQGLRLSGAVDASLD